MIVEAGKTAYNDPTLDQTWPDVFPVQKQKPLDRSILVEAWEAQLPPAGALI